MIHSSVKAIEKSRQEERDKKVRYFVNYQKTWRQNGVFLVKYSILRGGSPS
jgi:hypothetical protein